MTKNKSILWSLVGLLLVLSVFVTPIPIRGGWVEREHFSRYSGWYYLDVLDP